MRFSPKFITRFKAGAVLREISALEEIAFDFVDNCGGDRRLVGIDPDQDLHARVPPFLVGPPWARAKDIPTSCRVHTSFESPRTPGTGGTQAENKPTHLVGDRKLASDPCLTGTLEA